MASRAERNGLTEKAATIAAALIALAAIAGGIGFRLWHMADRPLWLDEAYSAYAADHGWSFLWHVVPQYETHPPFYYSLVRLWADVTGVSVAARRSLGVLCGLVTLPLVALAAQRLARLCGFVGVRRRWLVATALLLTAFQPLLCEMARQVRPYPVMVMVYAAGTLALLTLAEDARAGVRLRRGWIVAYFVAEALMLWLHDLGPLFGLAMTCALACVVVRPGLPRGDWGWLFGAQLLAGLVWLPAAFILLSQAPTWVASTWLKFEPGTLPVELSLLYVDWNKWAALTGLAIGCVGLGMIGRRRWGGRVAGGLLVLALLPTLISILLSFTVSPVFLTRTLSPAAEPGLLLVAAGLCWAEPCLLLSLLPLGFLAYTMAGIDWLLAHNGPPQDWYRMTAWIAPRFHPGDVVWAYPNEGALPLHYALQDERRTLPVRAIPDPVPAFGDGGYFVTGSRGVVSLYPHQIAALMRTPGAEQPATIWLLRLGPWKYDPGDQLVHALEGARIVVGHFRRGAIDVIGLRRTDLPPVAPAQQAKP